MNFVNLCGKIKMAFNKYIEYDGIIHVILVQRKK